MALWHSADDVFIAFFSVHVALALSWAHVLSFWRILKSSLHRVDKKLSYDIPLYARLRWDSLILDITLKGRFDVCFSCVFQRRGSNENPLRSRVGHRLGPRAGAASRRLC